MCRTYNAESHTSRGSSCKSNFISKRNYGKRNGTTDNGGVSAESAEYAGGAEGRHVIFVNFHDGDEYEIRINNKELWKKRKFHLL